MNRYGETNFYLENNFWSSLLIKRSDNAKQIIVKASNINDEIKKFNTNFLIIDIKGGEVNLLLLIDFVNINKLLIEFHPTIVGDNKTSNLIKLIIKVVFLSRFV